MSLVIGGVGGLAIATAITATFNWPGHSSVSGYIWGGCMVIGGELCAVAYEVIRRG